MKNIIKPLANKISQSISQPQHMRKFYKQSSFVLNPTPANPLHKYLIKLDEKTMRTPYRHQLAVPSSILALLITSEFNRQEKYLKTGEMPMLALCRTAVDADIEGNIAQHLKSTIIEYLLTDTLNFYEDYYEEEYEEKARKYLNSFSEDFKMKINPSSSLQPPQMEISPQFMNWLNSLNNWQLIGMQTMTIWLKSTISAYNLTHIQNSEQIQRIQEAATLEQIVQMKQNGEVQQKLMHLNQLRLMINCGLMMFQHGTLSEQ